MMKAYAAVCRNIRVPDFRLEVHSRCFHWIIVGEIDGDFENAALPDRLARACEMDRPFGDVFGLGLNFVSLLGERGVFHDVQLFHDTFWGSVRHLGKLSCPPL